MNHRYSSNEIDFIRLHASGKSNKDLTNLFNQHFKSNLSVSQIKGAKKNRKISSGITGNYSLGSIPWNKGTKGLVKPNKGNFKKGNVPHNHVPVGTTLMKSDGYLYTKTNEPNIWRQTHRLKYEKEFGTLTKDQRLVFLDGDQTNINLDNLCPVSKAELLICNKRHLLKDNKEISSSGIMIAKTLNRIHNLEREVR